MNIIKSSITMLITAAAAIMLSGCAVTGLKAQADTPQDPEVAFIQDVKSHGDFKINHTPIGGLVKFGRIFCKGFDNGFKPDEMVQIGTTLSDPLPESTTRIMVNAAATYLCPEYAGQLS